MIQMMEQATDIELLREYTEKGSEDAFARLVSRHVDLVYSTALRQVRERDAAREITQTAFIILMRKADRLDERTVVSAWLYRTARFAAADFLKVRARRIKHEQEAARMEPESNDGMWAQVEPLLDDAVNRLGEADRTAILLRFFENKSLREVGAALGVNQDSAQKRVARALERLRKWFAREGVVLSASAFASWPERAVQSAPDGIADAVVHAAVSTSTISLTTTTLVKGTMKTMAWMQMKMAAVWLGVLLLAGGTTVIVAQKVTRGDDEADRSTPVGALRYLANAYRAFDGDKVVDSFDTNSLAKQQVVLAMGAAVSAEGRLRRTMAAKFSDASATNQRPAFMMNFGQERLDEAEAEMLGSQATVTIPGRNREPLRLAKTNGVWRITEAAAKGDERTIRTMNAAARVADELNAEVKKGDYASTAEVMKALQQRMLMALKR